jgi:hypothetical protein
MRSTSESAVVIQTLVFADTRPQIIVEARHASNGMRRSLTETVEQFATSRSIRAGSALNYECLFLALNVIPEGGKIIGLRQHDNSPDRPSELLVR